jgi:eukaryotic-like serine/threonine-protein kinase
MSIEPGVSFGPYEIVGSLGAGGMGEVYRARDSRLNRDVAIKVLPVNFAADPDRRARFEREAQAIASLSHPNILAIFDTGMHEGQLFIVTELLEGDTLRAHIGSLSVRKATDIGVQVARGLTAAHDKGLVHRDLKPENIFLLADGQVKILDFGLARQTSAPANTAVTSAATAAGATDPGVAVGTAGYMSPEQVRGADVDHRTDIFAFGSVLYEMLSGKRAFQRETAAETMTAILKEEPQELAESGLHITPQLDRIVRRCLEKQPRLRFQSAADLGFALEAASTPTGTTLTPAGPADAPAAATRKAPWWIAAATFIVGFVLAAALTILRSGPAKPDVSEFHFTPFSFEAGGQGNSVWSQDGKAVAYMASMDKLQNGQVFVRYLDSPVGKQLTHFQELSSPRGWSADGRRILFISAHPPAGIWSVAVAGGEPESVMPIDQSGNPQLLEIAADSSAAAIMRANEGKNGLWISSPLGSPLKKYSPEPFATATLLNLPRIAFSPDRKQILLFMNSGDRGREEAWLMPYPADPSHPPRLIFQDFPTWAGTPNFSWMPDSRRIVVSLETESGSPFQLFMADTASGKRLALTSQDSSMQGPHVSPDGNRLIFTEPSGSFDLVSLNLSNAVPQPLIATERNETMPAWALNQPVLTYITDRGGPSEIWLQGADGVSRPLVTARDFPAQSTQWFIAPTLSPAADRVLYTRLGHSEAAGSSTAHLWISSTSGGAPTPVTNDTVSSEFPGAWSPDGNWIVYMRLQNGKADLMKVKSSGQAEPVVLKADLGGSNSSVPTWSPTGEWIEYNDRGEHLVSPDGKTIRDLGSFRTDGCTFSRDGKLVYCVRLEMDHEALFSLDVAAGAMKPIGQFSADYRPRSSLNPGVRISLAPDGKSVVYAALRSGVSNLWLMEGFAPKEGWLERLRLKN